MLSSRAASLPHQRVRQAFCLGMELEDDEATGAAHEDEKKNALPYSRNDTVTRRPITSFGSGLSMSMRTSRTARSAFSAGSPARTVLRPMRDPMRRTVPEKV